MSATPAPSSDAPQTPGDFESEVREGQRFEFGKNWAAFLTTLTEERIGRSENSLRDMLGVDRLDGRTFLDAGSGSGLSSLAARRLGADVISFDYDPQSVACTQELRRRFFPGDPHWRVLRGSVLDRDFVASLGPADVVYSWGVLHHTGAMWEALESLLPSVRPRGTLWIAIYNDQGWKSQAWHAVKRIYCSGRTGRWAMTGLFVPAFAALTAVKSILRGQNCFRAPDERGMSVYYDWVDWLGGYPFEVATPQALQQFCEQRGFTLVKTKLTRRLGCNQLLFRKAGA